MSVMPEQVPFAAPQNVRRADEPLVFAAASILKEMAHGDVRQAVRVVKTNDRCFRLIGQRMQTAVDASGPILLVFVEPIQTQLPEDAELRSRFGLTRKEARVARLIADDRSNGEIAAELCISPHTARHHTERILAKLGVKSRTKVRNALVISRAGATVRPADSQL